MLQILSVLLFFTTSATIALAKTTAPVASTAILPFKSRFLGQKLEPQNILDTKTKNHTSSINEPLIVMVQQNFSDLKTKKGMHNMIYSH